MAERVERPPSPCLGGIAATLEQVAEVPCDIDPTRSKEETVVQQATANSRERSSILKRLWMKLGLDTKTMATMFKGSLSPAIAIAMYQAKSVQERYGTLGYLVAISSLLGFAILPRGEFMQNMFLNVVAICLAAAVNLMALYCVVQARIHTTPPTSPADDITYNAAASAVCGVWLFLQIYVINVGRAARPKYQFPAVLCSIFASLSMTNGVLFPSMSRAMSFMKQLLEAFLTGFGLATSISLVIFPNSSRKVVWKEMAGYLMLMSGFLGTIKSCVDNFDTETMTRTAGASKVKKTWVENPRMMGTPALVKLKGMENKLVALHSKLNDHITLAEREIAIGKLETRHLIELWKLMRQILFPVIGISSMLDTIEYLEAEQKSLERSATDGQFELSQIVLKRLQRTVRLRVAMIEAAFQHILVSLELIKPEKAKWQDEESSGNESTTPGTIGFVGAYKEKLDDDHLFPKNTSKEWWTQYDDKLSSAALAPDICPKEIGPGHEHLLHRYQRQLLFTIYIEYLLKNASSDVLDLLLYVDNLRQDGTLKRSKLIFPQSKKLFSYIVFFGTREDVNEVGSYTSDVDSEVARTSRFGESLNTRKDPEHLPPRNAIQKIGNVVRLIPKFFRSEQSRFGLRVAAATMTIGILCFLRDTQHFFLRQRLRWAMNAVALSMNTTAGQSIFSFVLRIIGTALATVASYVIWYIVDGHPPGVIICLWVWIFMAFYVVVKSPKFIIAALLSMTTALVVIGYELQVKTLGVQVSEQNGQPAYPTYKLAPYRLATVASGLLIAFIWTIFPYPISESSELRKDISASLYLISSYYNITHETVTVRVLDTAGDENVRGTHAYNLATASRVVFLRLIRLWRNLQKNTEFSKYQVRLGGDFPRYEYEELVGCIRRLILWMTLASYASRTFQTSSNPDLDSDPRYSKLRNCVSSTKITSKRLTSLLCILSSCLSNGQPLPQYLETLEPIYLGDILDLTDRDIWHNVNEPEACAFAVIQVVSQRINTEIGYLATFIKKLVGEIDLSFDGQKFVSNTSSRNLIEK